MVKKYVPTPNGAAAQHREPMNALLRVWVCLRVCVRLSLCLYFLYTHRTTICSMAHSLYGWCSHSSLCMCEWMVCVWRGWLWTEHRQLVFPLFPFTSSLFVWWFYIFWALLWETVRLFCSSAIFQNSGLRLGSQRKEYGMENVQCV